MVDYRVINGVVYIKAVCQFKNKLQALKFPTHTFAVNPHLTESMYTGGTSAFALGCISAAMKSPHESISLYAHKQLDHVSTRQSMFLVGGFIELIEDMISKLGFEFLNLNKVDLTLTYEI